MALRVGIISAAWGAFAHLPAWRAVPGVEVIGICTSRRETAEAAAQRCNIERPYWDAQAMIADPDIDIVDCGTRPSVRHDMVMAALRQNKHVYNGIPCAADFDRARELHAAWKASRSVAIVDAYAQWLPAHQLAKGLIEDGSLGRPLGGRCSLTMSLFNAPHPQFPYNWFSQAGQGVSAIRNLGSHALHTLVFLFGEIEEVSAHDTQVLKEWKFPDGAAIKPETNDYCVALLRFKSGMTMQLEASWNAVQGPGWHLEAFGENGRIELKSPTFPTVLDTSLHFGRLGETAATGRPSGGMEKIAVPESMLKSPSLSIDAQHPVPPAFPMAISMEAMVKAIGGGAPPKPDFEQAFQVERVQEAIRRASEERRWVRLAEIA